ncbi:MAG: AMP-binding protein, partial [Pseudomonadota bacterium]|nr:AMP-binding protein [Pseudomonadota bacterium]
MKTKGFSDHFLEVASSEDTKNRIAIVHNGQAITYKELLERINQRASALHEYLLRTRSLEQDLTIDGQYPVIGLAMPRSAELIITLLASWQLGYVCSIIDYTLKSAKLNKAIENIRPELLIINDTEDHTKFKEAIDSKRIVKIHEIVQYKAGQRIERVAKHETLDDELYIAYTSGTVSAKHSPLLNTNKALLLAANAHIEILGLTQQDKVLQISALQFDALYIEVAMTLLGGAALVIPDVNPRTQMFDISAEIQRHAITIAIMPSSLSKALNPKNFPTLRVLVLAGESMTKADADRWLEKQKKVFNGYGLVQDGICTTLHACTLKDGSSNVTIGNAAIEGKTIFLIDEKGSRIVLNDLEVSPDPKKGQLCIAGGGLAKGYYINGHVQSSPFSVHGTLHADENRWKTAGFDHYEDEPIYKTGDIAEIVNSHFFIRGRLDRQLQIAGVTVNPETVESELKIALSELNCGAVHVFVNAYVHDDRTRLQAAILYEENDLNTKNAIEELEFSSVIKQYRGSNPFFEAITPSRIFLIGMQPKFISLNNKLDILVIADYLRDHHDLRYLRTNVKTLPRNKVEKFIEKCWRKVVGLPKNYRIDINTHFSDIGGYSLAYHKLLQTIEEEQELTLSMLDFYDKLTIAGIASHLVRTFLYKQSVKNQTQLGVEYMQTAPAVFAIHPVSGGVREYEAMFNKHDAFPANFMPYTCCCPSLIENNLAQRLPIAKYSDLREMYLKYYPCTKVETQAEYLASAIRSVALTRDIYLLGWSYGGYLACEVAEKLHKGNRVKYLGLLDTLTIQQIRSLQNETAKKYIELVREIAKANGLENTKKIHDVLDNNAQIAAVDSAAHISTLTDQMFTGIKDSDGEKAVDFARQITSAKLNFIAGSHYTRKSSYLYANEVMLYQSGNAADTAKAEWEEFFPAGITVRKIQSAEHLNLPKQLETVTAIAQDLVQISERNSNTERDVGPFIDNIFGRIPLATEFIGRKEQLDQLHELLNSSRPNGSITNVHGFGGVGKTTLVREYITKHVNDFRGGVFWFNADTVRSLLADYKGLAECLRLRCDSDAVLVNKIQQWFSHQRDYLIVLENVESFEEISERCPIAASTMIMISRVKLTAPIIVSMPLDVFDITESCKYMREKLLNKQAISDEALRQIAERLSNLALALEQGCALINVNKMSLDNFIEMYDSCRNDVNQRDLTKADYKHKKSMVSIWQMTRKAIENRLSPDVTMRGLLDLIDYFSFVNSEKLSKKVFDDMAAQICSLNRYTIEMNPALMEFVNCLSNYCIIKINRAMTVSENTYSVHRLLQDVIFDQLPLRDRFIYLQKIFKIFIEYLTKRMGRAELLFEEVISHFERLVDRLMEMIQLMLSADTFSAENNYFPVEDLLLLGSDLLNMVIAGYHERRKVVKAEQLLDKALEYFGQICINDHLRNRLVIALTPPDDIRARKIGEAIIQFLGPFAAYRRIYGEICGDVVEKYLRENPQDYWGM